MVCEKNVGGRLFFLDVVRVVCVLWIVGFWHPFGGGPGVAHDLTTVVLGTYLLISGFLVGRKAVPLSVGGLADFYRSRLLRLYPLFLLALLFFLLLGISKWGEVVPAAFLVSDFSGDYIATLWFIPLIFFYYLVAPLLMSAARSVWVYLVLCGSILFVMASYWWLMDVRLLYYLLPFATGVFLAVNGRWSWRVGLFWGILIVFLFPDVVHVVNGLYALLGSVALFYVARWVCVGSNRLVLFVSEASFCMYLFHRPIYLVLEGLYYPSDLIWQYFYVFFFGLPVVCVLSWLVQRGYDGVVGVKK